MSFQYAWISGRGEAMNRIDPIQAFPLEEAPTFGQGSSLDMFSRLD
jgi:hypothetical protein